MSRLLRRRPTPGPALAAFVLVLALGGTALASGGDNPPTAKKGHHHALTAKRVHKIVARYVKHHPGPRGRRGATGAAGAAGAAGAKGAPGSPGPAGQNGSGEVFTVFGDPAALAPGEGDTAFVDCPAGMVATGGGYITGDDSDQGFFDDPDIVVEESDSGGNQWVVFAENDGDGSGHNADAVVIAHAVCSPGRNITPTNVQARHRRSLP